MNRNVMNEQELDSLKLLKVKYRKGNDIIQPFPRINSPQEIRSFVLTLRKYWKTEKGTFASCRRH